VAPRVRQASQNSKIKNKNLSDDSQDCGAAARGYDFLNFAFYILIFAIVWPAAGV
jgi:hypothetical protein